jgi:hypothetical protein
MTIITTSRFIDTNKGDAIHPLAPQILYNIPFENRNKFASEILEYIILHPQFTKTNKNIIKFQRLGHVITTMVLQGRIASISIYAIDNVEQFDKDQFIFAGFRATVLGCAAAIQYPEKSTIYFKVYDERVMWLLDEFMGLLQDRFPLN